VIVVLLEELVDESGYRLNFNGRFSHSRCYLTQVMEGSGFAVRQLGQVSMRREDNRPVPTIIAAGIANAPD
jgi:predicted TPR repeat methyltransferase